MQAQVSDSFRIQEKGIKEKDVSERFQRGRNNQWTTGGFVRKCGVSWGRIFFFSFCWQILRVLHYRGFPPNLPISEWSTKGVLSSTLPKRKHFGTQAASVGVEEEVWSPLSVRFLWLPSTASYPTPQTILNFQFLNKFPKVPGDTGHTML